MNQDVEKLLKDRYFLKSETTWEEIAKRISNIYPPIFELLRDMHFVPSSPTLQNANTKGERLGTLSSCFPMDIEDSIENIGAAGTEAMIVTKLGGGVGYDFSKLRSSYENIKSIQRTSSGPLPFMNIFNSILNSIQQGGVRRGAGMAMLSIYHPDILNFVDAKLNKEKFARFNFSVKIPDEFYKQLKTNPQAIHQVKMIDGSMTHLLDKHGVEITVQSLWNKIVANAWAVAEPGIFNETIAFNQCTTTNLNNFVLANPCSEFVNIPYSSCNLGSLNISQFVDGTKFNWERLHDATIHATKFLDAVIDANKFPLKKIEKVTNQIRPIGLGIMGVAHAMYKKKMPYSSDKAYSFVDELMRYITLTSMQTSAEMAKEKGAYEAFDYDLFMKANARFFKKNCREIDVELLSKQIKKHGIRNSCFTSIAPTGSISFIAETSSGIEPVFALSYSRKIEKLDSNYDVVYVSDPLFGQYLDDNFPTEKREKILKEVVENNGSCQGCKDIPKDMKDIFVVAGDLTPIQHLQILQAAANATSLSVSKTINLPSSATLADVEEVYLKAYVMGVIGVTVYRDGCREGILVHGNSNGNGDKIIARNAPKRPKSLPCEVYRVKYKGEDWISFIGFLSDMPYEIFLGKVNKVNMPKSISTGEIIKIKSGHYRFENKEEEYFIDDIGETFDNESDQDAVARLISGQLRHGVPIHFVVDQLNKSKGDITQFAKALARVLKVFIKDGEVASGVCPDCRSKLVYLQGCVQCSNPTCGFSKCG